MLDSFEFLTTSQGHGINLVSLWHCWGGMEAQICLDRGFKVICGVEWLCLMSISLLTMQHRQLMGFRSGWLAGQLSPVIPRSVHQLPVALGLWTDVQKGLAIHEAGQPRKAQSGVLTQNLIEKVYINLVLMY